MGSVEDSTYNINLVRTFDPTASLAGLGAMTISGTTLIAGEWYVAGNDLIYDLSFSLTLGGVASAGIEFPLPIATIQNPAGGCIGYGGFSDFVNQPITLGVYRNGSSGRIVRYNASNFPLGACSITLQGRYRINDL